jgi:hypothetical protein
VTPLAEPGCEVVLERDPVVVGGQGDTHLASLTAEWYNRSSL